MSWGGLNPALTAWRDGINALLPGRDTTTDGGYADSAHGGTSQHQADQDGTVDAFDMDVNLLGSASPDGNADEQQVLAALKRDFMADPRAHLYISNRRIAQHDRDNWAERDYTGASPHTEHCHWESHEQNEKNGRPWDMSRTIAVLNDLGKGPDDVRMDEFFESVGRAVRGEASATGTDRRNRDNLADALQFAYGLNYTDQSSATFPAGRDEQLVDGRAAANATLSAIASHVVPPQRSAQEKARQARMRGERG